jgi:uncharacterized membrane protein required for colicin V production
VVKSFLCKCSDIIVFLSALFIVSFYVDQLLDKLSREQLLILSRILITVFFLAVEIYIIADLIKRMVENG